MKKLKKQLLVFCLLLSGVTISAQDTVNQNLTILDLKMQLLEMKLKNAEPEFQVYANQTTALQNQIDFLNFRLENAKDSIERMLREIERKEEKQRLTEITDYKRVIKINPERFFEGSFLISYEQSLSETWSVELGYMGSYVTKGGFGGSYLGKQDLAAYNEVTDSYYYYEGNMITGNSVFLKGKNYLQAKINPEKSAPLGLFAGPQFLYRRINISGMQSYYEDSTYKQKEVTENLDVYGVGLIIGGQYKIAQVMSIEIYAGGMMRFSKYTDEKKFTRYKSWNNIDYSGILPTAGINIGILK